MENRIKTEIDEPKMGTRPPACIKCGKELPTAQLCYCDEHREYADKDWQAYMDADPKWFAPLVSAILKQIMTQYRTYLGQLYRDPLNKEYLANVLRMQKYIRSDDFAILTMGIAEPDAVIRVAQETVAEFQEQKRHEATLRAARRLNAETLEKMKALQQEVSDLKKLVTTLRKEIADVNKTIKSEGGKR